MAERDRGTALIVGGSIGGLFAAAALLKNGWAVRVLERVDMELAGRGAGIVTHAPLIDALQQVGASVENLGVAVNERLAFDRAGRVVHRLAYPQIVTSWDRIHQLLRGLMPKDAYRIGCQVSGYSDADGRVLVHLANGETLEADVLIGADGFRSSVRAGMLPEVKPDYAGYVVWRGVASEADLPPDIQGRVFPEFSFFAPNGCQVVGYPIAGPNNDLRPGHRRYNFVWYDAVPPETLDDMLTDASGHRHAVSIPPPLVRDDVLAQMRAAAKARLPAEFSTILHHCARPFFTPIYDHCSPTFAAGRVALAGDAACVARPHVGMGVTKAAEDALTLARCLNDMPVAEALKVYSQTRVPASRRAYEQARRLGALIFDTDRALNTDGDQNPSIKAILADTAVPVA